MSQPVISVENLSKKYRLGQIGTGTLTNDLKVWWARVRGRPNPLLKVGQADHGNRDGETIWALKDVSFTVEQGEVLGIIGRNGAGKSTLLKILSRVTAPTSGEIKVKGRIASLLEVGTGFHPDLTGRENIYLNGAILGMSTSEVRRRFDEIVSFAEIEQFVDTPVKRYSSGMYVRLAFAVAAHLDPEILLVDEVLAVGDVAFQKKCLGKMSEVAKGGRTVLFVSHNMASINNLCPNSLLLSNGIIGGLGISESIIHQYLSIFHVNKYDDLLKRKDREGNGLVRIKDFSIYNKNNQKVTVLESNSEIIFEVEYDCLENQDLNNVVFEIKIIDRLSQVFSTLSTYLSDENFPLLPPRGKVYCRVPNLIIGQGSYSISVDCYVNRKLADNIQNVTSFSVVLGTLTNIKHKYSQDVHGPVLLPYQWFEQFPPKIN